MRDLAASLGYAPGLKPSINRGFRARGAILRSLRRLRSCNRIWPTGSRKRSHRGPETPPQGDPRPPGMPQNLNEWGMLKCRVWRGKAHTVGKFRRVMGCVASGPVKVSGVRPGLEVKRKLAVYRCSLLARPIGPVLGAVLW